VPDPATSGPAFIQIGSEGGFLPAPVLLPNQPVVWNVDPTMFNVGNVLQQNDGGGTLFLGPAERADIIVDFSKFAGKVLILYNDAPTAFPALDPHYDYYTGAPDRTGMGGSPAIPAGVGPNIRTIMQIVVAGSGGTAPVNDYNPTTLTNLQAAFVSTGTTPGVFAASQDPIVVGQTAYNTTYNATFPARWPNWGISRISDNALSFMKVDGTLVSNYPMKPKAIHDEMGGTFDDYGRMAAKLGLEVPFSNAAISTFALQNYVDPATEMVKPGQIQIWKITHNGVDTHPIHFHLFDVQVINRVGWDGFIRLPDPNELGWKDTVRMAPLEDTIVALRPVTPRVPFALPNSIRPLNPTTPLGSDMGFSQIDPLTGAALAVPMINTMTNFGWEYVWHCHILSHEENDMMRPLVFKPVDHIGVFRGNGEWFVDVSGNGAWDAAIDKVSTFGTAGDIPIAGDWNGGGTSTAGAYKGNGTWWLDLNGNNILDAGETFQFGIAGDVPVVGDWNGNGITKIGVFRNGEWFLDVSGNGAWGAGDVVYQFGIVGDTALTGDWAGLGKTSIGIFRNGQWYLDSNGNGAFDFGTDTITNFGIPGDAPVTGDWTGAGTTKIGVFRNGQWYLDMNGNGVWNPGIDVIDTFGIPGDKPVTGKW
jgi:FtsP/CotA-like multicopper oxidase with cupredoxin domain